MAVKRTQGIDGSDQPAPSAMGCRKLTDEVIRKSRAAYPILYIPEEDEGYIKQACQDASADLGYEFWYWDVVRGLIKVSAKGDHLQLNDSQNPKVALNHLMAWMVKQQEEHPQDVKKRVPAMLLLHDFGFQMQDAGNRRWLRNLVKPLKSTPSIVILTGPGFPIPPELTKEVLTVHLPMPDAEATEQLLYRNITPQDKMRVPADPALKMALIEASSGLSYHEKECAFAEASSQRALTAREIWKQKARIISSPELKFVDTDCTMADIGGLDLAKAWIKDRMPAYGPAGKAYGLPAPLGCVFLGPPGTGKSVIAEAIGNLLDMPVFMMDIRSCMRPHVGESERILREVMARCEEIKRAVVIFDEFEKMFQGASTSGHSDSGLFISMFGNFLSWAAKRREKGLELFFAATCNAVKDLSSALTRCGRFDVIWWVGLPNRVERESIFTIHAAKHKNLVMAPGDAAKLAAACQGYSGAEIEQGIVNALFVAFKDGARKASADDVLYCIKLLKPCSELYAEELREMERWKSRTMPASSPDVDMVIDHGRVVTEVATPKIEEGLN